MSNTTELDRLELEIAESLPDHPTLAQILGAIRRGVRGGFSIGVLAGERHQAHVTDLVNHAIDGGGAGGAGGSGFLSPDGRTR